MYVWESEKKKEKVSSNHYDMQVNQIRNFLLLTYLKLPHKVQGNSQSWYCLEQTANCNMNMKTTSATNKNACHLQALKAFIVPTATVKKKIETR